MLIFMIVACGKDIVRSVLKPPTEGEALTDSSQILPTADYNGNGYLEGYGGPNYHAWHNLGIK